MIRDEMSTALTFWKASTAPRSIEMVHFLEKFMEGLKELNWGWNKSTRVGYSSNETLQLLTGRGKLYVLDSLSFSLVNANSFSVDNNPKNSLGETIKGHFKGFILNLHSKDFLQIIYIVKDS